VLVLVRYLLGASALLSHSKRRFQSPVDLAGMLDIEHVFV
jgi:hypothetical protein